MLTDSQLNLDYRIESETEKNKTVQDSIDRRIRPRCCHLGSYFKRQTSSPGHPLACNW